MGVPVLEELQTWKRQPQKFSERARLLFFCLLLVFFYEYEWGGSPREKGKKREEKKEGENEFFLLKALLNAKVILVCRYHAPRCPRRTHNTERTSTQKKKEKRGQKEKEGEWWRTTTTTTTRVGGHPRIHHRLLPSPRLIHLITIKYAMLSSIPFRPYHRSALRLA